MRGGAGALPLPTPTRCFILQGCSPPPPCWILSEICSCFLPQPRQPHPASCDPGLQPGPQEGVGSPAWLLFGATASQYCGEVGTKAGRDTYLGILFCCFLYPRATHW